MLGVKGTSDGVAVRSAAHLPETERETTEILNLFRPSIQFGNVCLVVTRKYSLLKMRQSHRLRKEGFRITGMSILLPMVL